MFECLKKFNNIIVTGPQRSGTRICAKMIAKDTSKRYKDEFSISWENVNSNGVFLRYLSNESIEQELSTGNTVIQCSANSFEIERYSREDTCIIFMWRETFDILKSERRIGWTEEVQEKIKYQKRFNDVDMIQPISTIKKNVWEKYQKNKIIYWMYVYYESLKLHEYWVDKNNRKEFKWNQTTWN